MVVKSQFQINETRHADDIFQIEQESSKDNALDESELQSLTGTLRRIVKQKGSTSDNVIESKLKQTVHVQEKKKHKCPLDLFLAPFNYLCFLQPELKWE